MQTASAIIEPTVAEIYLGTPISVKHQCRKIWNSWDLP